MGRFYIRNMIVLFVFFSHEAAQLPSIPCKCLSRANITNPAAILQNEQSLTTHDPATISISESSVFDFYVFTLRIVPDGGAMTQTLDNFVCGIGRLNAAVSCKQAA